MPTCVIIGCTSGYHSNPEKSHFFTIPRDPKIHELWKQAIEPSAYKIRPGQCVCEKHFLPEEIMWERKLLGPDGTVLGTSRYKIPRLQKGSVPSIFPWSELINGYTNISIQKQTDSKTPIIAPLDKMSIGEGDVHFELRNESSKLPKIAEQPENTTVSSKQGLEIIDPVITLSGTPEIICVPQNVDSGNTNISKPAVTFQKLLASDLKLPIGWNRQTRIYNNETFIVFSFTKFAKIGGILMSIILKELILNGDMSFQINALGKPIDKKGVNIDSGALHSIKKLEDLLLSVSGLNVCAGTKLSDEQNRDIGNNVYQDPSGTWRHVSCSFLWNATVCSFCRRARKSFFAKARRNEKRGATVAKRIRLQVVSEDRRLLKKLHDRENVLRKVRLRAKETIVKLKSEIADCRKKMSKFTMFLDNYLKSAKLPENQMCALRKIVSAAKGENLNESSKYSPVSNII